jgi:hypothetical protein
LLETDFAGLAEKRHYELLATLVRFVALQNDHLLDRAGWIKQFVIKSGRHKVTLNQSRRVTAKSTVSNHTCLSV